MSTYIDIVEERLISQVRDILEGLQWKYRDIDPAAELEEEIALTSQVIENARKEIKKLMEKRQRQYDLLEEGTYTSEDFLQRGKVIAAVTEKEYALISEAEEKIKILEEKKLHSENTLPRITSAMEFIDHVYENLDPQHKNEFLCGLIDYVVYDKPKGSNPLDFKLEIHLKL